LVSDLGFVFIKSDDGQSVEFEKGQGPNGPKAVNVKLIEKGS
jgi:cold shock CspA family protein